MSDKNCNTCLDFPGATVECDCCSFNETYPRTGEPVDNWKKDPDATELEDENKKLKAILKECCDYLNYPGSIRYIGEGSRLHMEMEEAIK